MTEHDDLLALAFVRRLLVARENLFLEDWQAEPHMQMLKAEVVLKIALEMNLPMVDLSSDTVVRGSHALCKRFGVVDLSRS
ncbi:hypothetical protein JHK85_035646 [Glycine max]|nr:hypothetical protein JHK85_035646 [Glycine max]